MFASRLGRAGTQLAACLLGLGIASAAFANPKLGAPHAVDDPIPGGPQYMAQRIEGMAASNTQFLAAWMSEVYESEPILDKAQVQAQRIDASGAPIGQPISLATTDVINRAQVASDGTNFLVVFSSPTGAPKVKAHRVAADGTATEVINLSFGNALHPAVTFDGTNYVILCATGSSHVLHAARVSPAGKVVGSTVDLGIESGNGGVPMSIAFGAGQFLVAYSTGDMNPGPQDLHLVRLAPDLTPLAPPVLLQSNIAKNVVDRPRVTFGGDQFLVSWRGGGSRRRTRVTADGTVLDPGGVAESAHLAAAYSEASASFVLFDGTQVTSLGADGTTTPLGQTAGADVDGREIACGPAGCVAAWSEPRFLDMSGGQEEMVNEVFGTSLASGPVPGDDHLLSRALGNRQRGGAVASDGDGFLVVWRDSRLDVVDGDLWGVVTDAAGVVQGSAFEVAGGVGANDFPQASFDGTNYLVTWDLDGVAGAVRVSPAGQVLGPVAMGGASAWRSAMVGTPAAVLMAWTKALGAIEAAFVSDGVLSALPPLVADGNAAEIALATDGNGFLLAWHDLTADQVLAMRLGPTGAALDAPTVLLDGRSYGGLAAGFDGAAYVVVFEGAAASIDPTTGAVTSLALDVCCGLSMVHTGMTALLATVEYANYLDPDHMQFTRIAPGGQLVPTNVDLGDGNGLSMASNGKGDVLLAYDRFDAGVGARRLIVRHLLDDTPDPPDPGSGGAGGAAGAGGAGVGGGADGGAAASASTASAGPAATTGAGASAADAGPESDSGCACGLVGNDTRKGGSAAALLTIAALAVVALRRRGASRARWTERW